MSQLGHKQSIGLVLLTIFLFPSFAFAQNTDELCSTKGYTILVINGVFNNNENAARNKRALEEKVNNIFKNEPVIVDYIHNPSHVGGGGDIVDALYQKTLGGITALDYDLKEIWKQASEKVKTQKLLLVGHSQGNFYVNNLYENIVGWGKLPSTPIGIYAVATPASYIASRSNGKHITSTADGPINALRLKGLVDILPNNVDLPRYEGFNGHSFADDYLKHGAARIISEIEGVMKNLVIYSPRPTDKPCIPPPDLGIFHTVQGAGMVALDFTADVTLSAVAKTGEAIGTVADASKKAVVYVGNKAYDGMDALGNVVIKGGKSLASGFLNFAKSVAGISRDNSATVSAFTEGENAEAPPLESPQVFEGPERENVTEEKVLPKAVEEPVEKPEEVVEEKSEDIIPEVAVEEPVVVPTIIYSGGGGGGGSSSPDPEPDITPPDAPVVDALATWAKTDSILVTGTAEINATINITGGLSTATGVATNGVFSVQVFLNPNTANTLTVTAVDTALNASLGVDVTTTHDNVAPAISRAYFAHSQHVPTAVVGATLTLDMVTDASDYSIDSITINDVAATNFQSNGISAYRVTRTVVQGETDRSSGTIPVSIVLKDPAGNTNTPYTAVEIGALGIYGQGPSSVYQAFPTFTPDGKFTQNVTLNCISNSGNFLMYYVRASDSVFKLMSLDTSGVGCPGGVQTSIPNGFGFADMPGYSAEVGWYYGAVTIGTSPCTASNNWQVCNVTPIQAFFRLYRNADGTWSDTDIPPDETPPSITSYTYNGVAGPITTDPLLSPLTLVLNADEDVEWVSIKIENELDDTIYKMFFSGEGCVDDTNTCTKVWDGILSSGGLLTDGVYKLKVHIKDASDNEYFDYLPDKITIDVP